MSAPSMFVMFVPSQCPLYLPPFPTSIPSPNESNPRNEEAINFLLGRIIKLRYEMLPINIAGTRPLNWG